MKTTVEISDPLFRTVKTYCGDRGISFRQVVERGLRLAVSENKSSPGFRLKSFGFKGDGQIMTDWSAIRDAIYEGRGANLSPKKLHETMTAADTNILVYAHRIDSPFHDGAARAITILAESQNPWAIPWPCVHEFLAVVTNGKIFRTPTPPRLALRDLEVWMESPGLNLIGESSVYWDHLKAIVTRGNILGPRVHDARIAAICKAHGVDTLLSADRDFSQFTGLAIVNPLKSS